MDPDRIKDALARLREEGTPLPPKGAELIAEIERRLQHPDDTALQDDLRRRVSDAIREFEVEHPRFTAALGQLIAAFSNMGI